MWEEHRAPRCGKTQGDSMGKLLYGDSDIEIEFDDRALTHLQSVIGS